MAGFLNKIFVRKKKNTQKTQPVPNISKEKKYHDHFLDCKEMLCPKPIFEISSFIKNIVSPGEILMVECRDPSFRADIIAWTKRMNCNLQLEESAGIFQAYITKNNE